MEIITKEKPKEEYIMEYIARDAKEECQILLNINEQDVIAMI